VVGEVARQFLDAVMAWMAGSSPAMTVERVERQPVHQTPTVTCVCLTPSVITGLEPVIHAMTAQKHCPQTRPSTASQYERWWGEVARQFIGGVMAWMAGSSPAMTVVG
jgi:hypothetical protein